VDYFSLDELRRQYEELLRAHRDYVNSPSRNTTPQDREHRADLQRTAEIATETFKASFGERLFHEAIEIMTEWASQQLLSRGVVDGAGRNCPQQESFATIEECSARLAELTTEFNRPGNDHTARAFPWPFVRKIRYVSLCSMV
jgi:hypothetical protein